MLWLQSCIIVLLIKAAIFLYQLLFKIWWGFRQKQPHFWCMCLSDRERERLSFLWTKNPEWCFCWTHFSNFLSPFGFSPSLCPLSCVFPPFFQVYFAFVTFFSALLFSLSVLWGRRICHLKERKKILFLGQKNFFPHFIQSVLIFLLFPVFCSPLQWSDQ